MLAPRTLTRAAHAGYFDASSRPSSERTPVQRLQQVAVGSDLADEGLHRRLVDGEGAQIGAGPDREEDRPQDPGVAVGGLVHVQQVRRLERRADREEERDHEHDRREQAWNRRRHCRSQSQGDLPVRVLQEVDALQPVVCNDRKLIRPVTVAIPDEDIAAFVRWMLLLRAEAKIATFAAPPAVDEGSALPLALINPSDPSSADAWKEEISAQLDELDFELPLAGGDISTGEVRVREIAGLLRRHLGTDDPLTAYADDTGVGTAAAGEITPTIVLSNSRKGCVEGGKYRSICA